MLYATDQWKYPLGAIGAPPLVAKGGDVLASIQPVANQPLKFTAASANGLVTLSPLNQIIDQRFNVYWQVSR